MEILEATENAATSENKADDEEHSDACLKKVFTGDVHRVGADLHVWLTASPRKLVRKVESQNDDQMVTLTITYITAGKWG